MKLLIVIIQNKDAGKLQSQFVKNNIQQTKLSTTGGFLRSGNTTFMIGIKEERVQEVLDLIKKVSRKREQYMTPPVNLDGGVSDASYPVKIEVGGSIVMEMPMDNLYHF
ncbi:cyclic-di-AMP receptor [Apilactobacillus apisilvae]|uniref:Cyclic-di-AMP receptor n=1 Tax=Apilactobacillus apisilvae TaxID=2923364 RepID=A0ABY4PHW1_9LACO|nr:cyclic-di-AMP receptor [Apilactobacillus apisilvae]UQS85059.1 cyclic-di-AMP receptor [Apilactobacillus apisilvae]